MGKKKKQFRLRLNSEKEEEWIGIKKAVGKIGEEKALALLEGEKINLLPEWFDSDDLQRLNDLDEDSFKTLVYSSEKFLSIEDDINEFSGVRVVNAFSTEIRTLEDLIEYHEIGCGS